MRACLQCGIKKEISAFYLKKRWYRRVCKECDKSSARQHRRDNLEAVRAQERVMNQNPWRRAKRQQYKTKSYFLHPEKQRARNILNYHIRSGRLKRQPCEVCGVVSSEAHHEDYSKPLDVRWLCMVHHRMAEQRLIC